MAIFNITGTSSACGESGKKILVPFKYGVGSTVFVISQAKKGIMQAVTITDLQFVKDIRAFNKYFVLYNNTYYEDELCDEACAREFAITYWTNQEEWVIRQLQC